MSSGLSHGSGSWQMATGSSGARTAANTVTRNGMQSTFLVDPAGRIRYQALGGREWEKPVYLDFLRALARKPPE
jgi:hypothetical protein